VCTPFAPGLALVAVASGVYSLGSAFGGPAINSLCSKMTPESRQGELFGLLQASRSIGFLVGPMIGGVLFDMYIAAPYLLAGVIAILATLLVTRVDIRSAKEARN
jgi:MFS family permease